MKSTSIVVLLVPFFVLSCPGIVLSDPSEGDENGSFVFKMTVDAANKIQLQGEPYVPKPGDLVLFDDHSKITAAVFRYVGTSGPTHAAIVLRRPDGSPGLLEAGPSMVSNVFIFDVVPRLHNYSGSVYVRRLKNPLSEDQSARLTHFALNQEGKGYAWLRLLSQGTPFRPHGQTRQRYLGKTFLDRNRWTCSELTASAATAAGILDPRVHFANAMYPRDLAYDETFNLSPFYHPMELWYPRAQLRWVGSGVETGYPGPRKPLPPSRPIQ